MLAAKKIIEFPKPTLVETEKETKLRKDGKKKETKQNKQKGRKSEVYAYQYQDIKKMLDWFSDKEKWLHYLAFVFGINMARRVNDTLSLKWWNLYNPATGQIRDEIEIVEQKTDKIANPCINSACRNAIKLYCEKTGCNPADNNYNNSVFLQLDGNFKGRVLSSNAHRLAIKEAAADVGITYNVGTHSARKTFGSLNRMLHPGDNDSMQILQSIFNHSDVKTTSHYIGLTKEKVNKYFTDFGDFFDDYVLQGKEFVDESEQLVTSIKTHDLRDIIAMAYEVGRENAAETNPSKHIEAINEIQELIDSLTL